VSVRINVQNRRESQELTLENMRQYYLYVQNETYKLQELFDILDG